MDQIIREIVRFKHFALDLNRGCVQIEDRVVDLRPKTFEVLRHLVANAGQLVSKDELYRAAWTDVIVGDDSLSQCIHELRQLLGDTDRRLIKTIPRRGYLLDAMPIVSPVAELGTMAIDRTPGTAKEPLKSSPRSHQRNLIAVAICAFAVVTVAAAAFFSGPANHVIASIMHRPARPAENLFSPEDTRRLSALAIERALPVPKIRIDRSVDDLPDAFRKFIGVWVSASGWNGSGRQFMVIVTHVDREGAAAGYFVNGPSTPGSRIQGPGFSESFIGRLDGGTLRYDGGVGRHLASLTAEGRMEFKLTWTDSSTSAVVLDPFWLLPKRHQDTSPSTDRPSHEAGPLTLTGAPSVTVLPFTRTNDATSQTDAFSSIAANIATELMAVGRGHTIHVKAVNAGDIDTGPAALRQLGTRYAILGTIQSVHDKSQLNVRLIETETNQLVWGQMLDEVPIAPDTPGVIATQIAHLVAIQLLTAESHRPLPSAPSAEDYSLLGRARLLGERGATANRDAHTLFEKALALDPNSVTAMLGFARTTVDDVLNGWVPMTQRAALLDRAEILIQRVIELEPLRREGHLQRGVLARARKDIDQAITAFEHTLALSPRYPQAHAELGRALMELGRADDTITHIRDAIRLSPTDNALYIWCLWAGMAAVHTGDYEAALLWLRRSRQANHSFDNTLIWLALAHEGLGHTEEAKRFLAEFMGIRPRFTISRWALAPPYRNDVVAQQRSQIAALMLRLGIRQDEAELSSSRERP